MFTGIVEDLGRIAAATGSSLSIVTRLQDIKQGDSVAVNGICLTATRISPIDSHQFSIDFDFSPETRERTGIRHMKPRDIVNLERAMKAGDRIGGHFLTGHVESTAKILEIKPVQGSYLVTVEMPQQLAVYIVPKGSIGVDGISLTVAARSERSFTVAVIPHTMEHTTLRHRKTGDTVNLEPDVLAKYIENNLASQKKEITLDFLKEHGYL